MDAFAHRLLDWFDQHGRHDLPWQRDATPYHVWLSEIMLQQTQVTTVIPYYASFVASFPTIYVLAEAHEDAVLHLWSGLGYYARARNLHKTAKLVVAEHDGLFPANLDALQALPGIGRSTAGAILSSALGGRAPILDGNVKRVLARFHAVEGWPGKTVIADALWTLAEAHTPRERVADYTQAIMDLGATLCTRSSPDCEHCPVEADCDANSLGRQADFPGRKPKKTIPTHATVFAMALTPSGELFLQRRPARGIWGGLWCFPEAGTTDDAVADCEQRLSVEVSNCQELAMVRHSFSHYHLEIKPVLLTLARTPTMIGETDDLRSWPAQSLPAVGIAAPVKRIWREAAKQIGSSSANKRKDAPQ
ncbi:MAG: A/G-specific adenine glycosylase [Congregibacter sp.]